MKDRHDCPIQKAYPDTQEESIIEPKVSEFERLQVFPIDRTSPRAQAKIQANSKKEAKMVVHRSTSPAKSIKKNANARDLRRTCSLIVRFFSFCVGDDLPILYFLAAFGYGRRDCPQKKRTSSSSCFADLGRSLELLKIRCDCSGESPELPQQILGPVELDLQAAGGEGDVGGQDRRSPAMARPPGCAHDARRDRVWRHRGGWPGGRGGAPRTCIPCWRRCCRVRVGADASRSAGWYRTGWMR
jgi:hypothetical protein